MNLLNIQTFLHIVRYQNISAAASAMYTSQPTISSRLSQLEEELGVVLIKRKKGHRSIEITEKGKDFIPIAEHWLELDRQTKLFSRSEDREPLTLAAPGSLQEHMVPDIVNTMLSRPNPPRIRLRTSDSTMIYSIVADHEVDVGLALRFIQREGTIAIPVFSAENVLLCPANTLLPDRRIRPEELDPRYEIRVTSWTGDSRRWHDSYWDPYVTPYVQVDNNHMTHNYMTDPRCWAICPASIAVPEQTKYSHRIALRLLDFEPPKHVCYMVVRRGHQKNMPQVVEALRNCVLEYAEQSPLLEPVRSAEDS